MAMQMRDEWMVCYNDQDRVEYEEIIHFSDEDGEDQNILSMINTIDDYDFSIEQ